MRKVKRAKRLEELTWEDVEREEGIIIIPVGSVEQHGRHLPLGTDSMVAIGLAEEASARTGVPLAPPLWYGWSPHHMVLPGTVTVRPEVLEELLYDIIASLSEHGFKHFIIINGHRVVNIPWIQLASARAKEDFGIEVYIFDPAYASKELKIGELGHAEEIETSHMMVLKPELVRKDKIEDSSPEESFLYLFDPASPKDTLCYIPSRRKMEELAKKSGGVNGKPSKASLEIGERYHEHLVARLVELIEHIRGV
ncbi:MAG: creatininase family protein [Synergistetes bacterium]|nr:creatininase family protein [Synergistota bacterium]